MKREPGTPPDLAGDLRAYRGRWGLSRAAAARALGVSPTTWARWEEGRAHPRGLILRELLRMLRRGAYPGQLDLWD
ncbi:MAG: helix-turn-helix domain-containing protein [Acidobacteriota bacterium]|jgi:DNA-binding transcriptional regulator YiaG